MSKKLTYCTISGLSHVMYEVWPRQSILLKLLFISLHKPHIKQALFSLWSQSYSITLFDKQSSHTKKSFSEVYLMSGI